MDDSEHLTERPDRPTKPIPLSWSGSWHLRRLTTLAALSLAGAVIVGRAELAVIAIPLVFLLAVGARLPEHGATVSVEIDDHKLIEGEETTVRVALRSDERVDGLDAELRVSEGLALPAGEGRYGRLGSGDMAHEWIVTGDRWGRRSVGNLEITAWSPGRLFVGRASIPLETIDVYPHPPQLSELVLPARLPERIGDHVSRTVGEGREFAGVRPYVPGDRQRRINWVVSSRKGRLHVNQFAAEHAADVVVVIDTLSDVGPYGRSTLDLAVRGATGVARAYLRAGGDRLGIVTLAGVPRWLRPDVGERQFYRIIDTVLEAGSLESVLSADLDRIPRIALPAGALVILFSPLLDDRAAEAVRDLRERGFPVIVVDTLTSEPVPEHPNPTSSLALRLWRLDRRLLPARMAEIGVPVVSWDGERSLTAVLHPLTQRRIPGATR